MGIIYQKNQLHSFHSTVLCVPLSLSLFLSLPLSLETFIAKWQNGVFSILLLEIQAGKCYWLRIMSSNESWVSGVGLPCLPLVELWDGNRWWNRGRSLLYTFFNDDRIKDWMTSSQKENKERGGEISFFKTCSHPWMDDSLSDSNCKWCFSCLFTSRLSCPSAFNSNFDDVSITYFLWGWRRRGTCSKSSLSFLTFESLMPFSSLFYCIKLWGNRFEDEEDTRVSLSVSVSASFCSVSQGSSSSSSHSHELTESEREKVSQWMQYMKTGCRKSFVDKQFSWIHIVFLSDRTSVSLWLIQFLVLIFNPSFAWDVVCQSGLCLWDFINW